MHAVLTDGAAVEVRRDDRAGSFEASVDGQVAGVVVYERVGDRLAITHTVVEPAFRSRGIATVLVRAALDELRSAGEHATNYCSFVREFVHAHPEYVDVVDDGATRRTP